MKLITGLPPNIVHAVDTDWNDINVTAYVGGDAGSVAGVQLQIANGSGGALTFGVRKGGTSGVIGGDIGGGNGTQMAVGVDSNNIFQMAMEDASEFYVWLIGYWTTDEVEFLDDAVVIDLDEGVESYLTPYPVDIGSEFTGIAYGAMCWIKNNNSGADLIATAQVVNGPDRGGNMYQGSISGWVVPATSEVIELVQESSDIVIYVIGAITSTSTITKITDSHDIGTADVYEDKDLSGTCPAGAVGVIYHAHDGTGVDYLRSGVAIRADGESFEIYPSIKSKGYSISRISAARAVDVKSSNTDIDFHFIAYLSEPSPAGQLVTTKLHDIEAT